MIEYYEGFDYGGEVAEKDTHFKLWPTTGNKTCLVDADLLPYKVGFMIDAIHYLEAEALVAGGSFRSIKETPQFESAFEDLCKSLNYWIRSSGCDSAILYSTDSSTNFRLDIAYTSPYKGQRHQEKPPFFSELKSEMTNRLGCVLSNGIEADDMLSIEASVRNRSLVSQGVALGSTAHKEFCDFVIASSDKDSTITVGNNYNPDTRKLQWITELGELLPKYKKGMVKDYQYVGTGQYWTRGENAGQEKTKRVLVGEKPSSAIEKLRGSGLKFFYAQIIMGDVADNYVGLSGKGKTYAYNLLNNCTSERELYMATLAAYEEYYGKGTHWCPIYKGTSEYATEYNSVYGRMPPDYEEWKGRGAYLTAYDRMLEQGRLAWMQQFEGDIWRKEKGRVISANDKEFWKCR